ncbi:MAG: GNAT family N-acetyltransferase [Candidatus Omnitrophica bacterium]|nr:GNAT family N-acetyltransferase [Candidatus Omnitrophota bacterium]
MIEIKKLDNVEAVYKAILLLHEKVFCEILGFDLTFKDDVKKYLNNFSEHYDDKKDGLFVAYSHKNVIGSIIINSKEKIKTNTTRIRLFVVSPDHWKQGIGKKLLEISLKFCKEKKFSKVVLWTFKELETAHHLYLKEAFKLVEEREVDYWGQTRVEQKFVLDLK